MSKKNTPNDEKDKEKEIDDTAPDTAADTVEETEECETSDEDDVEVEENPLQEELDALNDKLLRVTAEYSNFRKRTEKEKSDTYAFATKEVIEKLLPVADNLERALSSEQEDYDGLKKGVSLTYDGLLNSFEQIGVTVFGEPGDKFDPSLHQAVAHVEDDELEENVITDVFQKGYKLKDLVIRHAMVKTAN